MAKLNNNCCIQTAGSREGFFSFLDWHRVAALRLIFGILRYNMHYSLDLKTASSK